MDKYEDTSFKWDCNAEQNNTYLSLIPAACTEHSAALLRMLASMQNPEVN